MHKINIVRRVAKIKQFFVIFFALLAKYEKFAENVANCKQKQQK